MVAQGGTFTTYIIREFSEELKIHYTYVHIIYGSIFCNKKTYCTRPLLTL